MATHYIGNEVNSNQYYFEGDNHATSQASRPIQDATYNVPVAVTSAVSPSEYSPYPTGASGARVQSQQIRSDRTVYAENDSYQLPQQHQSVAGFNKNVSQQQYQSSPSPVSNIKATVRTVHSPDPHMQQQQQQQYVSSAQFQSPQQTQQRQQVHTNYEQQGSPQLPRASSHQHQYQYDSRTQVGQSTDAPSHYQTVTSQYTSHELNQRSDNPSQAYDTHTQAQQVPVRIVPNSVQPQHESSTTYQQQNTQQYVNSQVSPKQTQQEEHHEDQLQQYYSQLTPEQYQQLLRHQQIQRQQQEEQKRQQLAQQQYYLQQERQRSEQQQYQSAHSTHEPQHYDEHQQRRLQQGHEQYDTYQHRPQQNQQGQTDAYYEQQHRVAVNQAPVSANYQQDQYRSTVNIGGGQQYQQQHAPADSERQHQDEQEYYAAQIARQQREKEHAAQVEAAQRQQTASYAQQQEQHIIQTQQVAQPVGIRGLMNKFTGPTKIPTYEPKSSTRVVQQRSSSTHTTSSGPGQKTTTTTTIQGSNIYNMTYSALPKSQEPPVNSAEYFQMLQQGNINNVSSPAQSAAPPHIQGSAPGFGVLRDRFKGVSTPSVANSIQDVRRQQQSNGTNSSISSLRSQYINRATDSNQVQEESFAQRVQTVTQTVVQSNQSSQQQKIPVAVVPQQVQSVSIDDQVTSSDGAVAEDGSSSGASPMENDTNLAATEPVLS